MPVKGLMLVFWGLLIASLDLRLNEADYLPDPLGYALIFAGCLALGRSDGSARLAALAAFVLIFISIPTLVEHKEVLSTSGTLTYYRDRHWVLSILKDLIDLVLVWRILSVIHVLSVRASLTGLENAAIRCRRLYLWLFVAGAAWRIAFHIHPPILWVVFVPFMIFSLVVIVKLLKVVLRAERELARVTSPVLGSGI